MVTPHSVVHKILGGKPTDTWSKNKQGAYDHKYHPKSQRGHHRCVECGHLFPHEERGVDSPPWMCLDCREKHDRGEL